MVEINRNRANRCGFGAGVASWPQRAVDELVFDRGKVIEVAPSLIASWS
jgi:hypothetical protein